jgi:carboxyl-terminal processing protease
MNRFIKYLAILTFFCACQKSIPIPVSPNTYPIQKFSDVFEAYWNGMNERYVFWDWDTTNWDRIYQSYKPLFARLDDSALSSHADEDTVIMYLKEITAGLIDGHYEIQSLDTLNGHTTHFSPSYLQKLNDPFFVANPQIHAPYFQHILPGILDSPHISGYTIYQNDTIFAVSGTIDSHILYLYFKSFYLEQAVRDKYDSLLDVALQFFFRRFTADSASTYTGIIIDVRDNVGGQITDINYILGRIVANQHPYGYVRTKTGNGRLDYSPWTTTKITPDSNGKPLAPSQKLVVLADNWSQSAAEQFTMAVKTLPNTTFIGTTTWGATGPFYNVDDMTDLFSGPFNIGVMGTSESTTQPYGIVKTSSAMFKYINGTFYEGHGFPPDILVPEDSAALYSVYGDSALQNAIRFLRQ